MQVLARENSLVNVFLAEMRDREIQKDSMRFRTNIERIGQIMAYEVSKQMIYTPKKVTTPLGVHESSVFSDQPVIVSILRAAVPFYQGLLSFFDKAESAFIGAYRTGEESKDFVEVAMEYLASPSLEGRILIMSDPMLATGRSMVKTYQSLLKNGTPSKVFVCSVIGSQQGVDYLKKHMPDARLIIGDIDPELNDHAYIVPGLGDAGDLAFGKKL